MNAPITSPISSARIAGLELAARLRATTTWLNISSHPLLERVALGVEIRA